MENKILMYCGTCKIKTEAKDVVKKDSSRGKFAQGKCVVCGRTMVVKLKKEDW